MAGKFVFNLAYLSGNLPWDTGVTPPEVYEFMNRTPPGRALDLGCGTGTNVIALVERGWIAEGVDFVAKAVRAARRKAHKKGLGDRAQFLVGDILSSEFYRGEYDLILDIGCFHSVSSENVDRYLENVYSHLAEGGSLLLYAHLSDKPGVGHGATEAGLKKLGDRLKLVRRTDGEESSRPSAWLELKKE